MQQSIEGVAQFEPGVDDGDVPTVGGESQEALVFFLGGLCSDWAHAEAACPSVHREQIARDIFGVFIDNPDSTLVQGFD